jgi:hypothetical protein
VEDTCEIGNRLSGSIKCRIMSLLADELSVLRRAVFSGVSYETGLSSWM